MPVEYITDDIDFSEYLKETEHKQKVRPATEYISEAKELLRNESKTRKIYLPWTKCNESFDFRPGEVTVWAGQNGHGKTDITTQVALSLLGQDQKVCIASFEMKPVTTINRMLRMYSGTNPFSYEYQNEEGYRALDQIYDEFGDWVSKRLWIYDQTGTAKQDKVLGMVRYCGAEICIKHVFVDSLMKCVEAEDDMNGQKYFVDQLCSIARDCDIHIHLVHHLKKPAKEGDKPDKHDTKGSGSVTDQVDNLFMVWRNKPKEDDFREKGSYSNKQTEPDCMVYCKKQRNYRGTGDGEPAISLWRHKDAGCFVGAAGENAPFFINYPHLPS